MEDLWAFNDERVVRAVANSAAPVICGVGHETDFTLCDFAADLRAPTPTAAAELATQITMIDLRASLQSYRMRLLSGTLEFLAEQKTSLSSLVSELRYVSPERRIQSGRQRVDELTRRARSSLFHHVQLQSARTQGMQRRLQALNPMAVLRRGYAVLTRKDNGSVVTRVEQASEEMNIRVSDGEFEVKRHSPVILSDRRE